MYSKSNKRKRKIFFIKQKICGFIWLVIAATSYYMEGDATLSLIAVPFGFYLIFTKRMVMEFSEKCYNKKIYKVRSSTTLIPLKIVYVNSISMNPRIEEYLRKIDRIVKNI